MFARENYVTLLPGETRSVTLTAETALAGTTSTVAVDGWNVAVQPSGDERVRVMMNADAAVTAVPQTGLPFQVVGLR